MEILRIIEYYSGIIIIIIILIALFVASYVKAPPDTAIIISGPLKAPRAIFGTTELMIPFLERKDKLTLSQIPIQVSTDCLTSNLIKVTASAVIVVQISKEMLELAAKNFLNENPQDIVADLEKTLMGIISTSISNKTFSFICKEREVLEEEIFDDATDTLACLGLDTLSCQILKIEDLNGIISNINELHSKQILEKTTFSTRPTKSSEKSAKADEDISQTEKVIKRYYSEV